MIKPYKKCKKCGAFIVSGDLCEDCKPMTNADRIRQMTDEELAECFASFICDNRDGMDCKRFKLCRDCRLAWIRQEVSEDAGTD